MLYQAPLELTALIISALIIKRKDFLSKTFTSYGRQTTISHDG
nr:MAG TPA: hypothetical protein [Caudoviricetes sp.]